MLVEQSCWTVGAKQESQGSLRFLEFPLWPRVPGGLRGNLDSKNVASRKVKVSII